jgi:hypothetical protein
VNSNGPHSAHCHSAVTWRPTRLGRFTPARRPGHGTPDRGDSLLVAAGGEVASRGHHGLQEGVVVPFGSSRRHKAHQEGAGDGGAHGGGGNGGGGAFR